MIDYDWGCKACGMSNAQGTSKCSNCGCPGNCNAHEVTLYETLLRNCSVKKRLECPDCHSEKMSVEYNQDFNKYFYQGIKRRFWCFKTLEIHIDCNKCTYRKVVEYIIPLFRKLYRLIARKDIQNEALKRI